MWVGGSGGTTEHISACLLLTFYLIFILSLSNCVDWRELKCDVVSVYSN